MDLIVLIVLAAVATVSAAPATVVTTTADASKEPISTATPAPITTSPTPKVSAPMATAVAAIPMTVQVPLDQLNGLYQDRPDGSNAFPGLSPAKPYGSPVRANSGSRVRNWPVDGL